jgi:hypothetical protein
VLPLPAFFKSIPNSITFPTPILPSDVVASSTEANAPVAIEYDLPWAHEFDCDISSLINAWDKCTFQDLEGYTTQAGGYLYQNVHSVALHLRKPKGLDCSFGFSIMPESKQFLTKDANGDTVHDGIKYVSYVQRDGYGSWEHAAAANTAVESYVLPAAFPPGVASSAHYPLPPLLRPAMVFAINIPASAPKGTRISGRIVGKVRCSGHGFHSPA